MKESSRASSHYLFIAAATATALTAAWELVSSSLPVELRSVICMTICVSLLMFGRRVVANRGNFALLGFLPLVLGAVFVVIVLQSKGQLSDEGLFANFASHALARGANPYVRLPLDVVAGSPLDPNGWTYRMDGTHVQQFSYPILALAVYFVLGQLPTHVPLAVLGSLVALVGSALLVQRRWGSISALVFVGIWFTSIFHSLVTTGSTDFLLIPPLIMIAGLLKKTNSPITLRISVLLAIIVGLKQTAWLMAPFLVLAAATDETRERKIDWWKFRNITLLTLLLSVILNAVGGMLFGFHAYWNAVLQPTSSALVPNGVGLADIVRSYGISTIDLLTILSIAGVAALFFLATRLSLAGRFFCAMATTLLPLLSHRGFLSYAIALTPILVCAPELGSLANPAGTLRRLTQRRHVVTLGCIPVVVMIAIAWITLASPSGALKISSLEYNAQFGKLLSFKLHGIGISESLNDYSYFVEGSNGVGAPWIKAKDTEGSVTLLAPNQWAGTDVSQGFRVVATNPRTKMIRAVSYGAFPTLTVDPIQAPSALRPHELVVINFRVLGVAALKENIDVSLSQLGLQGSGVRTGVLRLDQGGIGDSSASKSVRRDGVVRFTAECAQETSALQVVHLEVRFMHFQPLRIQSRDLTLVCR